MKQTEVRRIEWTSISRFHIPGPDSNELAKKQLSGSLRRFLIYPQVNPISLEGDLARGLLVRLHRLPVFYRRASGPGGRKD
jgi:hypothetical protein